MPEPTAPVTAEGLRERIAKALEPCEPFDAQLTERVMAAIAPVLDSLERATPEQWSAQLRRAEAAEGELIRLRNRIAALEENGAELLRRTEKAELELKRERVIVKRAERHAMRCDADQAAAEAGQARAEARHAGLNAHHLRTVADHRAELDTLKAAIEQARYEADQIRAERDHAVTAWRSAEVQRDALGDALETHAPGEPARIRASVISELTERWRALAALSAPEGPAIASTAVSAATEAHGGAGEAQEGSQ